MATITAAVIPYLYTEAEAVPVENILDITAEIIKHTRQAFDTLYIEVTVGTFQFASGETITSDSPTYTVGDKVPISVSQTHPLHLKAAAQNDAFKAAY